MTVSRLEVDLARLLRQCERMAADDDCDTNWRYKQYVMALQSQYDELKASPSAPSAEKMNEFKRRIEHLQSLLPTDSTVSTAPSEASPRPAVALAAPVITVSGQDGDVLAELRHRRGGRQQSEARAQLLGTAAESAAPAAGSVQDDFEAVMKRHHQMQEKAAEEMLALTRNLKEQSLIAKNVITKDRETLERSTVLTDQSTGRLQVESQRLSEFSARACRCWLWIMLGVVCATFMCAGGDGAGVVTRGRMAGCIGAPTVATGRPGQLCAPDCAPGLGRSVRTGRHRPLRSHHLLAGRQVS